MKVYWTVNSDYLFFIIFLTDTDSYRTETTYDSNNPQVYAAEAAAMLNKENGSNIKIYIGIQVHENQNRLEIETKLASESAKKSEQFFPGTVKGFVLDFRSRPFSISILTKVVEILRKSEDSKDIRNLDLGARFNCSKFQINQLGPMVVNEINENLRFIICEEYSETGSFGRDAFMDVAVKFERFRFELNSAFPQVTVLGQSGLPARVNATKEVEHLAQFWNAANKWARQENFDLVMTEAFDNTWSTDGTGPKLHRGRFGWWSVSRNNATKKYDIFEQKVPSSAESTVMTSFTQFGFVGVVSVVLLLIRTKMY